VTFDEAVEILEDICPCTRNDCADVVHRPLVVEAERVLREAADPEPPDWWPSNDDAPRGWEP